MYYFETFDPRLTEGAKEHNKEVFQKGFVLGIEVTIPHLAVQCYHNIDPQHGTNPSNRAAIEEAASLQPLPEDGTVLATVKPDLDSVGAMALLKMRHDVLMRRIGVKLSSVSGRISCIAKADRFQRGNWSGTNVLPNGHGSLWPDALSKLLAPIMLYVGDHSIPLKQRVKAMENWILNATYPHGYREKAVQSRLDLINAIRSGEIQCRQQSGICVVESAHRSAIEVGYTQAPVVIAHNPTFTLPDGSIVRKFTVCAYHEKYADIPAALADLAVLEPGWGGSKTIGGSPQDKGSDLSVDEVVAIVRRHLTYAV